MIEFIMSQGNEVLEHGTVEAQSQLVEKFRQWMMEACGGEDTFRESNMGWSVSVKNISDQPSDFDWAHFTATGVIPSEIREIICK